MKKMILLKDAPKYCQIKTICRKGSKNGSPWTTQEIVLKEEYKKGEEDEGRFSK